MILGGIYLLIGVAWFAWSLFFDDGEPLPVDWYLDWRKVFVLIAICAIFAAFWPLYVLLRIRHLRSQKKVRP